MRFKFILVMMLTCLALSGGSQFLAGRVRMGTASPTMGSSSYGALVEDLQQFIPASLQDASVPGLSIAVIQGGQLAWFEGFGVANTLTGERVMSDSVFEVASISKAVAAYTALRLVEHGDLSLDEPVLNYISQPWLPPSAYADRITLRQLLTHTSGLTNQVNPLDKSIVNPPGERYLYSGVGFIYLQQVLEQVTGKSLEQVAAELVFAPLGMDSSSYVNSASIYPRLVAGHIDYGVFLPRLLVVLLVAYALVFLLFILVLRVRLGRISISARMLVVVYLVAASLSLAAVLHLVGWQVNKWLTLASLWMLLFGLSMAVLLYAGLKLLPLLAGRWRAPQNRPLLVIIWSLISFLALLSLTSALSGPVPRVPGGPPNAAYSLRSTAPDLAKFFIEIASPQYLDPSLAAQMTSPLVKTASGGYWGLGIGTKHGYDGKILWHGGDNSDFHALMLIRPDQGDGVVVLTNGQHGSRLTREVASLALGFELDFRNN